MSLEEFKADDGDDEESETYWEGNKRPIIDEEIHLRVDKFATRRGLSNKEAYQKLITNVLTEDGKLEPKAKGAFAYDTQS